MNTNYTNEESKLIYPQLSYTLTGLCFDVHNGIGRFAKEKQYGDILEEKLKAQNIPYSREYRTTELGNILDFLIEEKRLILKTDYYQLQRYLQQTSKKLGLLVNFRNRYLKPIRVVRIDTSAKARFN